MSLSISLAISRIDDGASSFLTLGFLLPLSRHLQKCKTVSMQPIKRCKHFEIGGDKKKKGGLFQ